MNGDEKAVTPAIGNLLVKDNWSGLRGFPFLEQGVQLLVRTLCGSAISVSHAREIAATFDEICPTPREIKTVALNTRPRFEPPPPPPHLEWEKEYGPPQPFSTLTPVSDYRKGDWPGVGTREERQLHKYIIGRVGKKLTDMSWGQFYLAAQEWGVRLTGSQRDMIPTNLKLPPKPELVAVVSGEDIQKAVNERRAMGQQNQPLVLEDAFEEPSKPQPDELEQKIRELDQGYEWGKGRDSLGYLNPDENFDPKNKK